MAIQTVGLGATGTMARAHSRYQGWAAGERRTMARKMVRAPAQRPPRSARVQAQTMMTATRAAQIRRASTSCWSFVHPGASFSIAVRNGS